MCRPSFSHHAPFTHLVQSICSPSPTWWNWHSRAKAWGGEEWVFPLIVLSKNKPVPLHNNLICARASVINASRSSALSAAEGLWHSQAASEPWVTFKKKKTGLSIWWRSYQVIEELLAHLSYFIRVWYFLNGRLWAFQDWLAQREK